MIIMKAVGFLIPTRFLDPIIIFVSKSFLLSLMRLFVFWSQANDLQSHCSKEATIGESMNFQVVVLVDGASKQLFPLVSKVQLLDAQIFNFCQILLKFLLTAIVLCRMFQKLCFQMGFVPHSPTSWSFLNLVISRTSL